MAGRITNPEFDVLTAGFQNDLQIIFNSMREDVKRALETTEADSPEQLIAEIDKILTGEVNPNAER